LILILNHTIKIKLTHRFHHILSNYVAVFIYFRALINFAGSNKGLNSVLVNKIVYFNVTKITGARRLGAHSETGFSNIQSSLAPCRALLDTIVPSSAILSIPGRVDGAKFRSPSKY